MKRSYTHIKWNEKLIKEMRRAGKTNREIAQELGITKKQLKDWITRYNRRISKTGNDIPKQRGRKAAVTLSEYKYENKRLKMENELLRDFLHLAGRM